jgi:hypothetical protein
MKIAGTYLLIGSTIEPQVHMLTAAQDKSLSEGLAIAAKYERTDARARLYKQTFRVAADYAIPAWSTEAMTAIALNYTGPDAARVKALAARLALGETYGADEPGKGPTSPGKGPKGGQPALLDPVKPKPKRPGGAAAPILKKVPKRELFAGLDLRAERQALAIESRQR